MKAVVQRVIGASVRVSGSLRGCVDSGLLVYLGVALKDDESDADWLAEKIAGLRIFEDAEGKMNLSLKDVIQDAGETEASIGVLAVSQFTLLGDARKGRRPSWGKAAPPEEAKRLYEYFMGKIREAGLRCESGEFQAHMQVTYTNDGPVTILLDSRE
ncbi:MAG: D-tyrosyl-tRNA(Tyr) deacylase [Treponema sp.]|nr:D-tyrosyl-tRNA(Tyr) deacylase [Treponema sp.]